MQEIDPVDFYEKVVDDDGVAEANERVIVLDTGEALTVEVRAVERDWLFDQLERLPDEVMEVLAGAETVEEAEEAAQQQGIMANMDGETIRTFGDICTEGLYHAELTDEHWQVMVKEEDALALEVLFSIGAEVMELTLGEGGRIADFHEPDSARSSS